MQLMFWVCKAAFPLNDWCFAGRMWDFYRIYMCDGGYCDEWVMDFSDFYKFKENSFKF